MASSKRPNSMEDLFKKQDREILADTITYGSGGISFKGNASDALSLLNQLRFEGEGGFCDMILEVEGRQLATHRCILAASSQFFYNMFSSGMKDSNQTLLKLHSVSFDSVSLILDYFYTREIVINDDNVLELLNTASFLLVTPVKKACIKLLHRQLSGENCFSILQVAEKFGASNLAKTASNAIKSNFFSVVNNDEFVSISKKSLISFISSDEIQVEREEEVYQAVLKWVKYDKVNRASDLPELLSHLRGKSLPKGFLKSEMTKEPLLAAFSSLLEPSKSKTETRGTNEEHGRRTGTDDKPEAERTRPSTELHEVMIGISSILFSSRKAFCFDLDKKETFVLPGFPDVHLGPKVAVVGRSLYIIDGFKFHCVSGPTRLSALCLDEVQNQKSSLSFSMYPQWKTKRPCTVSRTCASLVELNGLLYYIGGLREDENICNTVECYNPEIDEWVFCASLNTSRSRSGCVVVNDHIYIIGGGTVHRSWNSGSILSSVERYDPEADSWSYVASMKQARELFSSVHLNGKIYVIGGLLPVSTPNCEVYSPNTDEWHSIASLPCLDTGVYAIVAKNEIVIPMSSDESHEFSHEALKYNVQSDAWQKVNHFGPNNKLTSFTLSIIKLPAMFLQRLPIALNLEYFLEDSSESDTELEDDP